MTEIAARIRKILEIKHLKQADLAKAADITSASMSNICSGKTTPSKQTIILICQRYNINEKWLQDGIEPMDAPFPKGALGNLAQERNLSLEVCTAIDKLLNLPNETLERLVNICVEIADVINGTEQPKTQAAMSAAETIINGNTKQVNNINHAENATFNAS